MLNCAHDGLSHDLIVVKVSNLSFTPRLLKPSLNLNVNLFASPLRTRNFVKMDRNILSELHPDDVTGSPVRVAPAIGSEDLVWRAAGPGKDQTSLIFLVPFNQGCSFQTLYRIALATCGQCYESFTGQYLQVYKCRSIF